MNKRIRIYYMKNILSIALLLFIASSGCKKDTQSTGPAGNWELRIQDGGIAGIHKEFAAGNGTTIQFNADNTFTMYNQFKLVNQGTFQYRKNAITLGTSTYDGLYYNGASNGEVVQLSGNTLVIGLNYDDGFAVTYVRL